MTLRSTPADLAETFKNVPSPDPSGTAGMPVLNLTTGVVQSIQVGPPPSLTCTIAGDTAPTPLPVAGIPFASSYYPRVGDAVFMLVAGNDHIVVFALASTAWTALTLTSPWTNYGGSYALPGFRIEGSLVRLRGLISANGATSPSHPFTMPTAAIPVYAVNLSSSNGGLSAATLTISGGTGIATATFAGTPYSIQLDGLVYPLT